MSIYLLTGSLEKGVYNLLLFHPVMLVYCGQSCKRYRDQNCAHIEISWSLLPDPPIFGSGFHNSLW